MWLFIVALIRILELFCEIIRFLGNVWALLYGSCDDQAAITPSTVQVFGEAGPKTEPH